MESEKGDDNPKIIYVNKQKFSVKADSLNAKQILELAGLDDEYDLFLVHGQKAEKLETEPLVIKNDMYFNAIIKSAIYG